MTEPLKEYEFACGCRIFLGPPPSMGEYADSLLVTLPDEIWQPSPDPSEGERNHRDPDPKGHCDLQTVLNTLGPAGILHLVAQFEDAAAQNVGGPFAVVTRLEIKGTPNLVQMPGDPGFDQVGERKWSDG